MWILLLVIFQVFSAGNGYSSTCSKLMKHRTCDLLPADDECGAVSVTSRVVGGEDAAFGQFPWVTFIMSSDKANLNKYQLCSGSVISNKYIISSGHCCMEQRMNILRIGEFDLRNAGVCKVNGEVYWNPENVEVEEIIVHENYKAKDYHNDICLIRLKNPLAFNECLSPICLPFVQSNWRGTYPYFKLEVAGWGIAMEKPDGTPLLPEVLQTLTLPVIPHGMCQWLYSLLSFNITPNHICAGGIEGQNICSGDSGGPLMEAATLSNQRLRYFLSGVSSFTQTKPCARKLPSVYVNVAKYVKWILDHMRM